MFPQFLKSQWHISKLHYILTNVVMETFLLLPQQCLLTFCWTGQINMQLLKSGFHKHIRRCLTGDTFPPVLRYLYNLQEAVLEGWLTLSSIARSIYNLCILTYESSLSSPPTYSQAATGEQLYPIGFCFQHNTMLNFLFISLDLVPLQH